MIKNSSMIILLNCLLERIKNNPEYQMPIDLREVPLSVDSIQMLDELLDKPYLYYAPENTVIVPIH